MRPAIWEALGGPWLHGVSWVVRLGVLGGDRATWETLEAVVLPWWFGALCALPYLFCYPDYFPLLLPGSLTSLLYLGSGNLLSILLGTTWVL